MATTYHNPNAPLTRNGLRYIFTFNDMPAANLHCQQLEAEGTQYICVKYQEGWGYHAHLYME